MYFVASLSAQVHWHTAPLRADQTDHTDDTSDSQWSSSWLCSPPSSAIPAPRADIARRPRPALRPTRSERVRTATHSSERWRWRRGKRRACAPTGKPQRTAPSGEVHGPCSSAETGRARGASAPRRTAAANAARGYRSAGGHGHAARAGYTKYILTACVYMYICTHIPSTAVTANPVGRELTHLHLNFLTTPEPAES